MNPVPDRKKLRRDYLRMKGIGWSLTAMAQTLIIAVVPVGAISLLGVAICTSGYFMAGWRLFTPSATTSGAAPYLSERSSAFHFT